MPKPIRPACNCVPKITRSIPATYPPAAASQIRPAAARPQRPRPNSRPRAHRPQLDRNRPARGAVIVEVAREVAVEQQHGAQQVLGPRAIRYRRAPARSQLREQETRHHDDVQRIDPRQPQRHERRAREPAGQRLAVSRGDHEPREDEEEVDEDEALPQERLGRDQPDIAEMEEHHPHRRHAAQRIERYEAAAGRPIG